jgi:hypothetical protein
MRAHFQLRPSVRISLGNAQAERFMTLHHPGHYLEMMMSRNGTSCSEYTIFASTDLVG